MQFIFIICSLLLLLLPQRNSLTPEGLALLSLKSAITSDPTHSLSSWSESDPTPCHWHGVSCSDNNNQLVTSISLQNLRLAGYISSELGLLRSLRSLDLSKNSLSGRIPDSIGSLQLLSRLDLSSNQLEGSLPESLVELRSLTGTLNLSWNGFSGEIPESYGRFPVRVSLDLGHNNLTGKVPLVGSLVNQGPTAFSGNPSLCGFPLQTPCPEAVNVNIPAEESRRRGDGSGENRLRDVEKSKERSGSVAVPLISEVTVVIGAITVSAWLVRRKYVAAATGKGKMGKDEEEAKGSKKETNIIVHGGEAMTKEEEGEGQNGKFVVMDEGFCLELEDLLRASAYVAGKGRSGILYKVVVGGRGGAGSVVAVRRLNDGGAWWLKEFESEVEAIEKVQHPNIVRVRAYYYASDEKLLVSDFIRNGSLYTALHGGPGNLLAPLPWAARLRIAQGAARGIMYIHEYTPRKNVHHHGNLKSTKILLDSELQPYISGFGLIRLVSTTSSSKIPTSTTTSAPSKNKQHFLNSSISIPTPWNNAYLAPEARSLGAKLTQKCDVYAFGIVLMELLTGKLPDAGLEGGVRKVFREEGPLFEVIDESMLGEVGAKTQILAVFHIALSCTEVDPEVRPRMKFVSESLDRIKMAVK